MCDCQKCDHKKQSNVRLGRRYEGSHFWRYPYKSLAKRLQQTFDELKFPHSDLLVLRIPKILLCKGSRKKKFFFFFGGRTTKAFTTPLSRLVVIGFLGNFFMWFFKKVVFPIVVQISFLRLS